MKNIFLFSFLILIYSCTPTASDNSTDNSQQTDTEKSPAPSPESNWETFWPLFQAAVATDDLDKVKELTHEELHTTLDGMYSSFFSKELKEVIANTKAEDVLFVEEENGMDIGKHWEISWEDAVIDDDGVEYATGKFLYFTQADGKIKLLTWLAAG